MQIPSALQVLEAASEILSDPDRWHQGNYYSDDGEAYCSIGAIEKACWDMGCPAYWRTHADDLLREVLMEMYPDLDAPDVDHVSIAAWNDAPERLHEEVVAVFEKARALAAERGM